MAAPAGFEPTHVDTKNRCLTAWLWGNMVGEEGFEPPNSKRTGLQPVAFDRFATPPYIMTLD